MYGHTAYINDMRTLRKIVVEKYQGRMSSSRLKMDLVETGCECGYWIVLVQGRFQWRDCIKW
jgi:hypothetical protein